MVKKLYKHEFLAWLRIMPVIYGIVLAIAAMHRIISLFESNNVYYNIIHISGIVMYAVGLVVCIGAPTVFGISRFYKNLFTGEGYLTFTLPVTPTAHLWVKSLTALCFSIASLLVGAISVAVIDLDLFIELWKAAFYLFKLTLTETDGHSLGYLVEFIVLAIVTVYYSHMIYSGCICVGQLSRKNRIAAAVGAYFAYYIITQIVGTIVLVMLFFLSDTDLAYAITIFIENHPYAFVHIALCGSILVFAALSSLFFLLCRHILHKRLNLE